MVWKKVRERSRRNSRRIEAPMHLRDGEDITADEVTAEPYFNSNLLISMETNDKFPFL